MKKVLYPITNTFTKNADGRLYDSSHKFVKVGDNLYPVTHVFVVKEVEEVIEGFSFVIYGNSYIVDCMLFDYSSNLGEDLNFTIDWGDGTKTVVNSTSGTQRTHYYPYAAEWTITIEDYISGWIRFQYDQNTQQAAKLRRILSPFPENLNRRSFVYCFQNCINLTFIPENLFANNPNITSFGECFGGCTGLTSIPENLFANNPKVTQFEYCFRGCSSLNTMPENLFANNPNVTRIYGCFRECTGLTSIPENLFANNTEITNFTNCFQNCINLTFIPENLFANNPNAREFDLCFYNCTGLTYIPKNLFANSPSAQYFSQCFRECRNLQSINIKLHPDTLSRNANYSYMFYVSSEIYSHQGEAPKLWEATTPASANRAQCFRNNTALTNYDDIPDAWK